MKLKTRLIGILAFISLIQISCAKEYPATVTIIVKDQDEKPVADANVYVSTFDYMKPRKKGRMHAESVSKFTKKKTDPKGLVQLTINALFKSVSYSAVKSGYYRYGNSFSFKEVKDGKWQPWNPTFEVMIRKIENPIPLYKGGTLGSSSNQFKITELNKSYGIDLLESDLVEPYGKGKVADIILKPSYEVKHKNIYGKQRVIEGTKGLDVSFSNSESGILHYIPKESEIKCELPVPVKAPRKGYKKKLSLEIHFKKQYITQYDEDGVIKETKNDFYDYNDKKYYFFKIKRKMGNDKQAKIHYGKIEGGFEYVYNKENKKGVIGINAYYLNPTPGDRNLEHARGDRYNLFKYSNEKREAYFEEMEKLKETWKKQGADVSHMKTGIERMYAESKPVKPKELSSEEKAEAEKQRRKFNEMLEKQEKLEKEFEKDVKKYGEEEAIRRYKEKYKQPKHPLHKRGHDKKENK